MKKLLAFWIPGLPQLLRAAPRLRDGVLFLAGSGSLIGIIGLVVLWPVYNDPMENFFWLNVPDMAEIYPLHLTPAMQAAGTILPILPENAHLLVRVPLFWQTLGVYCVVYLACAVLSFRDYNDSAWNWLAKHAKQSQEIN